MHGQFISGQLTQRQFQILQVTSNINLNVTSLAHIKKNTSLFPRLPNVIIRRLPNAIIAHLLEMCEC